ncbi:HFX_2341 family transcriptional regulator domain-containing protein, partial [Haloferax profundi]
VRGVAVQLTDFYDVMGVVTTIAEHHDAGVAGGDSVYVNVSSGPHVAAVAAAVGCMAVGARPYSVTPESYSHDPEVSPASEGVKTQTDLPLYPIDGPTPDQIAVLEFLKEKADQNHSVHKRNIIKQFGGDGDKTGTAHLECLQGTETKAWSSKYNRLDSKILDDLENHGYVQIEQRGRSSYVSISASGRNILGAFGHLLSD